MKPRASSTQVDASHHSAAADSAHAAPLMPRTDSQFLAQLPEFAEKLLNLSEEFEATSPAFCEITQFSETLRGWSFLERIARESLHERAREAARAQAEQAKVAAQKQAHQARPSIPRRTLQSGIRSRAMMALEDPGVLSALKQWTQAQNSKKR